MKKSEKVCCPECQSSNLEVNAEAAYVSVNTYKITKGKVRGYKKSDFKKPLLHEIRVFVRCADCDYETDNTNYFHRSKFDDEFIDDVTCQISDLIINSNHKNKNKSR